MEFEGFKAFRIPDDKRDEYFEFVDKLQTAVKGEATDRENWDASADPIIIIRDITLFSEQNQKAILANFARIGAKDVTEIYNDYIIFN